MNKGVEDVIACQDFYKSKPVALSPFVMETDEIMKTRQVVLAVLNFISGSY